MESLAKTGIMIVNIGLVIVALIFILIATTAFSVLGFVVSVIISIVANTAWFMIVDCYNKFIAAQKKFMES